MKRKLKQLFQLMKEHSLLLKLIFLGSVLIFVANQITHIVQGMSWQDVFQTMACAKSASDSRDDFSRNFWRFARRLRSEA
jgi:hypothetical protein